MDWLSSLQRMEKWQLAKNPNIMKPEVKWEDGSLNLERPQVWLNENGRPAMQFCAAQLKHGKDSINLPFNVHIPIRIK